VKRRAGLTLIEVVVALAILAIALGTLTSLLIGSMRQNLSSGKRTQAAQILNHLGRLLVGGDGRLLAAPDNPLEWDYGELKGVFPELEGAGGLSEPELYRVRVENLGTPTEVADLGVNLNAYRIEVCWKDGARDACVAGEAISAPPASGGTPPPLPLIN